MRQILFGILCVFAVGCADRASPTTTTPIDRNNTGVNVRDRDSTTKTSFDQNENQSDITITASIRQQVVDTKMSVDAQNAKIITQNGVVTLRGPVSTQEEKDRIGEIAKGVAGVTKVDNQLEIKN